MRVVPYLRFLVNGLAGFRPRRVNLVQGAGVTISKVDNDETSTITIAATGGGGGDVASVNGQTGVVVLDADDVGADPAGSAASAVAAANTYTDDEVAAEATARAAADASLASAITSEASTRGAADTALASDIAAEAAARAAADAAHVAAGDPHPAYALEAALGTAATKNVGTTAGTVAAGDDSRIGGAVQSTTLTTDEDMLIRRAGVVTRLPGPTATGQVLGNVGGVITWTVLSLSLVLCSEPCIGPGGQQGSTARAT